MKHRRFTYLIVMILLLVLAGCGGNGDAGSSDQGDKVTVRFLDQDGNEISKQTVAKGDPVSPPQLSLDGKTLEGWYYDFYSPAWSFSDPVKKNMELRALCTDEVQTVSSKLTYHDLSGYEMRGCDSNGVLVIFVRYTDGLDCDIETLERIFNSEQDSFDRLKSVSSYYQYNSYGKADLDFHFMIYDSKMTCKESYDRNSSSYDFLEDIFDYAKNHYEGDFNELDKNNDGYADLVIFLGGEDPYKTVKDGSMYHVYSASGAVNSWSIPTVGDPQMKYFIKVPFYGMENDPEPANRESALRVLIHEIGHAYGLMDYYDFVPYNGGTLDVVGTFDMQSYDVGDWNCFSRFSVGWLDPYLINDDIKSVTLKLTCSSENNNAILIPTSKGWNGTAFDEYLLIDVMAPEGANGYDWDWGLNEWQAKPMGAQLEGGVRILHVDARLALKTSKENEYEELVAVFSPVDGYDEIMSILNDPGYGNRMSLSHRYSCSNGYEPLIEGDSRFFHILDIVPRDGSDKYRISTPSEYWYFYLFSPGDLFTTGDVFSMEEKSAAFPNAPYANNGGTFDYSVKIEHYDKVNHEAIVTVYRP